MIINLMQNSFTSGELDPRLLARLDIEQYFTGASKIRNALVLPQGSVIRRYGLEYIDDGTEGGNPAFIVGNNIQMFKFVFSQEFQYTLVLTEGLMRVYRNEILKDTVLTAITDAQIPNITFAQEYSTLILFHNEFRPQAFIRQNDTTWVVEDWELYNIPSYNFAGTPSNPLQITDSVGGDIDFSNWVPGQIYDNSRAIRTGLPFTAPDIGKYIRALGGYALITGLDGNNAIIKILAPFRNDLNDDTTKYLNSEWSLEEPSWSNTRGWPASGTFFGGRFWVAYTTTQPNFLWGSRSGDRTDFQNWIPEFADNGIELNYGGGVVSAFHRLHAAKHLFILADTGEYFIPVSTTEPITPKNAYIARNSSYGSLNLPVFEVSGNIFFIRDGGKSLLEFIYSYADGFYAKQDLSLLASHLINDPISITYRKQTSTNEADYILVVNSDGTLIILCTLTEQKVIAWTKSETRGDFIATSVEDTDMYFIIDREIDGTPVRYLEKFNENLLVDCGFYRKDPVDSFIADLNQTDFIYSFVIATYEEIELRRDNRYVSYFSELKDIFTASSGQTDFIYTFTVSDEKDLAVFQNGTLLTLAVDYTVVVGTNTVTLNVGATLNDQIDIIKLNYRVDIGATTVTLIDNPATQNELIELYKTFNTIPYADVQHLTGEEVTIVLDNTIQQDQTVVLGTDITLERYGNEVHIGLQFPIVDFDSGSHVFIESMPIESTTKDYGYTIGKQKRLSEVTLKVNETSHAIVNKNKSTIRRIGIDPLDSPLPKISGNIHT